MTEFAIAGVTAAPQAMVPTLLFDLHIACDEAALGALLRVQVRIDARRRRYSEAEQKALYEVFGAPEQWRKTLHSMLWTHVSLAVPAFDRETTVTLPVTCTYDFEVSASRYLNALEDGEVPLEFLFSGHVFTSGMQVAPVPWACEAGFRLPVATYRAAMDSCFPNAAWIRIGREAFDALAKFKRERALTTWDEAVEALLV